MPFHAYYHLPFCRRRCPYCDFYKKVPMDGDLPKFIAAMLTELSTVSQRSDWACGPVSTAYLGGGTPSLHSPEEISAILTDTQRLYGIMPAAEITIEANPGTVTRESLTELRMAGINRLSLGGQSFSPRKLGVLYRDHTPHDIDLAVSAARAAGFTNLSLDLIFGLPGETLAEWDADLDRALALAPEHVSLYNLEYHEATPLFRWRAQQRLVPLVEDVEFELYLRAHERLVNAGYEHYEVSNFAKPGFRSRHNSAYWTGAPYVGFGPSAHSFDGRDRRTANIADVGKWQERVEQEESAIDRTWQSTPRELEEEWLSLALRRSDGLSHLAAVERLGSDRARALWTRAHELPADSRVITDTRLNLTPRGWFRENSILLFLFDAL